MKSYVFVFVPVGAGISPKEFRDRLHDCLASISDESQPKPAQETARADADKDEPLPFWTWFLPNPLPPPK
jgi:hypothetical protein